MYNRSSILQMAADQENRRKADEEAARRRAISDRHSDPLAAVSAVNRYDARRRITDGLLEENPHLTPEQAARLAGEYQSLSPKGGWTTGSRQDRIWNMAGKHNAEPAGDKVRQLARPAVGTSPGQAGMPAQIPAFLTNTTHYGGVTSFNKTPNPAYGKAHGLVWNAERRQWEPAASNADLERQFMELQMELAREKTALERQQVESDAATKSPFSVGLKEWLASKMGERA